MSAERVGWVEKLIHHTDWGGINYALFQRLRSDFLPAIEMSDDRQNEMNVGSDRVYLVDDKVVILAAREMADWTLREFCLRPIYFQDTKYYLKRKQKVSSPYAFRYELAPWHSELGAESSGAIHYDAEYVATRDREIQVRSKQDHLYAALFLLFPALGFCWSRFKQRVLAPIGFEPSSITEGSVMLGFGFFLVEALFVVSFRAGFLAVVFSWFPMVWVDRLLFALLPVDCFIRYGRIIRGDASPPGFLEWIFRRDKAETSEN